MTFIVSCLKVGRTIHTSMYEPKHLKAWMTLGENRPLYLSTFNHG